MMSVYHTPLQDTSYIPQDSKDDSSQVLHVGGRYCKSCSVVLKQIDGNGVISLNHRRLLLKFWMISVGGDAIFMFSSSILASINGKWLSEVIEH